MNGASETQPARLVQLIYVSTASGVLDEKALRDILSVSRKNNERSGITGVLVYKSGGIFQALEGDETAVMRLFETIQRDPRHHNVTKLFLWPINERSFAGWTMAFRRFESTGDPVQRGFEELLAPGFGGLALGNPRVAKMVVSFISSIR